MPYCYYPENYALYKRRNSIRSRNEETHTFENVQPSGFLKDITNLTLNVTCFDRDILRIRIGDSDGARFEVPFTNFDNKPEPLDDCQLVFRLSDPSNLRFQVKRKNSAEVL